MSDYRKHDGLDYMRGSGPYEPYEWAVTEEDCEACAREELRARRRLFAIVAASGVLMIAATWLMIGALT